VCKLNEGDVRNDNMCTTPEKAPDDLDDPADAAEFKGACMLNRGTVGDSACGGEGACFENSNDVGTMSCQGCEICRSSVFCLFQTGRNIICAFLILRASSTEFPLDF